MIDDGKRNVLGVSVCVVDYDGAVARILAAARERRPFRVSALAVHGVMTGVLDPQHRRRLNEFDLLVPDGQPVRWALNRLHQARLAERVYGPELTLRLCAAAAAAGLPVYFYGSRAEVLAELERNLVARFPGLVVCGRQPSRFRTVSPEEQAAILEEIRATGPALLFVGLGCPRQEVWAYENAESLGMPVIAVGAAFDFHAGLLPQAPAWMQRRGLEWLFRFRAEPGRLWRRYVYLNPLYLALLALQWSGLRRFPTDGAPESASHPSSNPPTVIEPRRFA